MLARTESASGVENAWSTSFDDGYEKNAWSTSFDDGNEKNWIRKGLTDELRLNGTKETVFVTTFRTECEKACYITSNKVEVSLADKEGNNWVKIKALAVDDVGAL